MAKTPKKGKYRRENTKHERRFWLKLCFEKHSNILFGHNFFLGLSYKKIKEKKDNNINVRGLLFKLKSLDF